MDDRQFGPYRLDELIGRGGMGEVYRAYDTGRRRFVALKRLPAGLAHDPEYRERFRKESALVAQLLEPHIIPIHDFGDIEGRLYIDMRLVEGTDLESVIGKGPLPPARAVDVISQVADALDAAHRAGLVHRDVKPSNVLLVQAAGASGATGRDFAYLIDFGIARSVDGTGITQAGMPPGTPQYMAPELFKGRQPDLRVDVYALTCVLYECLTGRRTHPADNLAALIDSDLKAEPPRPSQIVPDLPAGFDQVIAYGLAKEPLDRYPSAGILAVRARAALDTLPAPPGTSRPRGAFPSAPPRQPSRPPQLPPPSAEPPFSSPARPGSAPDDRPPVRSTGPRRAPSTPQPWRWAERDAGTPPPVADDGAPPSRPRSTAAEPFVAPPSHPPEATGPAAARRRIPRTLLLLLPALLAVVAIGFVVAQLGAPVSITVGQRLTAAAVNPARDVLYVADQDSDVVFALDVNARSTANSRILGVGDQPCALQVTPDGSRVYVANRGSNTVTVIDEAGGKNLSIPVGSEPAGLALSPDGRRLYVANHGADNVTVIDTASSTPVGDPVPVGAQPAALALSPDGRRLYVANYGADSVTVIDTAARTALADPIAVARQPVALAVRADPSGGRVYVANQGSDTASVIEVDSGVVIRDDLPAGTAPSGVAVRPDGRRVYLTGRNSGTLTTIDPVANDVVGDPAQVGRAPLGVTVTPDGKTVIVVGQDPGEVSFLAA